MVLGVFGLRTVSATQDGYVPIIATPPDVQPTDELHVILRPGRDLLDVQWRLRPQGLPPTAYRQIENALGQVPEGARLRIILPPRLPAPRTILEVTYFVRGIQDAGSFTLLEP